MVSLLALAVWTGRSDRRREVSVVFLGFLIASVAITLDYYDPTVTWLLRALGVAPESTAGWAIDKLESSVVVVGTILGLTLLSGGTLSSLKLQRGNLRRGLTTGLVAFGLAAALSIPISTWLFGGRDLSLARVLPWVPPVLVFVLANGMNEELLFRGLLLPKLGPIIGSFAANLLIAVPFTLMHTGVGYAPNMVLFAVFLFPLSLAWGDLLQKTDSVWGSALFHAGMDIPVVLAIFSTLP